MKFKEYFNPVGLPFAIMVCMSIVVAFIMYLDQVLNPFPWVRTLMFFIYLAVPLFLNLVLLTWIGMLIARQKNSNLTDSIIASVACGVFATLVYSIFISFFTYISIAQSSPEKYDPMFMLFGNGFVGTIIYCFIGIIFGSIGYWLAKNKK